jgi:hypothetical protein
VAVHGAGAAAFARELRARGIRAVTCATPPAASWLRGAGLDAAVLLDRGELLGADGSIRWWLPRPPRDPGGSPRPAPTGPGATAEAITALLEGASPENRG